MKTYLDAKEVDNLEKAATCFRDRLLIRLLFRLGCRISEALALKVEDIDFNQGTVTIQHLKTRLKLSCPECGARLGRSYKFCSICGRRDAFAVHAVKLDDSRDGLRLLQEHLGHVSFNTTARYRKVSGQEHKEWYQKLWGKSDS